MRKRDIEAMAAAWQPPRTTDAGNAGTGAGAAPRAQERKTPQGVVIDPSSVAAISSAVVAGVRAALLEIGPILARLAAADTVHSVDNAAKVMGNGIIEGQTAQALFEELGVKA